MEKGAFAFRAARKINASEITVIDGKYDASQQLFVSSSGATAEPITNTRTCIVFIFTCMEWFSDGPEAYQ